MSAAEPLSIRDWREDDVARIVAIEDASFDHPWTEAMLREELATEQGRCLVVERPAAPDALAELIGFALYWVVVDEVHLLILAVDPAWRRRGVAARLLAALEARGSAAGGGVVVLEVRRANGAARAFYADRGYVEVGVRPRYYAGGEDAVLMEHEIGPAPT